MNLFVKNFPTDIHKKLKMEAVSRGVTLSKLTASIIEQWLNNRQPKIRKPSRDGLV